jgi:hypothetical protein
MARVHTAEHMREIARLPRPGRRRPMAIPPHKPPKEGPAATYYAAIVRGLHNDISRRPPVVLHEMMLNFAATATLLREMNFRIAEGKGDEIEVADFTVLVNTLVKLGVRLGLKRIPKEVPTLEAYLHDLNCKNDGELVEDGEIELDADPTNPEEPDAAVQNRSTNGIRE